MHLVGILGIALSIFADRSDVYAIADYVSGAEQYEFCWEANSVKLACRMAPGVTEHMTPLTCKRARVVVRGIVNGVPQPWQAASREVISSPLPGDVNQDGVVGSPDYILVGQHWGESCQ